MDVNRVRWVVIMVFDLARFPGACTRWQLGDGGVQYRLWSVSSTGQRTCKYYVNTMVSGR